MYKSEDNHNTIQEYEPSFCGYRGSSPNGSYYDYSRADEENRSGGEEHHHPVLSVLKHM